MTSYFDEKTHQVEPGSFSAFGINLVSRYSKVDELIEMLSFAKQAAIAGISDAVDEVFYDSSACICSFKFKQDICPGNHIEKKLFAIAMNTIRQFDWFGNVHHGGEEDE